MPRTQSRTITTVAFIAGYERYLADFCGLAFNSRRLHLRVIRNFLAMRFASGHIRCHELRFGDLANFLEKEFRRLPNHWTQRVWLMVVRRFVRYLSSEGHIPDGWEDALPKRVNRKRASLPRFLSQEEKQALWNACARKTHRHIRDRAMLLVLTRLALRAEEVARLALKNIDWEGGEIRVCSSKTRRERMLPLPQDVGDSLIEHLRARPQKDSPWVFVPRRPPFTEQRRQHHVRQTMTDLFRRAGLCHARVHSLRHSAATEMVNRGATFKEIGDVLGHRALGTTLIYAKLDMKALGQVCLPWPGGSR
ncbi:MAG: tyrosine-type recombinase/integrase [Candidatus Acidiferrales bacterium]